MKSIKKNATLNIIKTICGLLFPLITFPYATRILGKFNYGKYSFATSIISYISLVSGFGISSYAIREGARIRDKREKLSVFINEIFTLNCITTIVAYLILFVFVVFWTKLHNYISIILILSLSIIFTTLGMDWINIIYEDYEFITKRYLICTIAQVVLMFLIVKTKEDLNHYAFVSVFSNICANILNIIYIRKYLGINIHFVVDKRVFFHIRSSVVFLANLFVTVIYINSDLTILGVLSDDEAVGIYSAASKIYTITKQIISAFTVVIIPRIAYLVANNEQDEIKKILKQAFGIVSLLVFPCTIGMIFQSKNIIHLLSGYEFIQGYSALNILALALLFATFGNIMLNAILIPFKKERQVLIITSLSAVVNVSLNVLLIPFWGYNATAITTFFAELIVFIGGIFFTIKNVKISIYRDIAISVIGGLITAICCIFCKKIINSYIWNLFASIISSGIIYMVYLYLVKDNLFYSIMISLKK